ncbi:MAG: hypothetical protein Q8R79_06865 [Legionellaceae bacterium]|nr:hypothetical protein [Legionellaceae bacterium]
MRRLRRQPSSAQATSLRQHKHHEQLLRHRILSRLLSSHIRKRHAHSLHYREPIESFLKRHEQHFKTAHTGHPTKKHYPITPLVGGHIDFSTPRLTLSPYRHILRLLLGKTSHNAVRWLQQGFSNAPGHNIHKTLRGLNPGAPLSPEELELLLHHAEYFEEPAARATHSPTPFETVPRPWQYAPD